MLTRKLFGVMFAKCITQFKAVILKQYERSGGLNPTGLEELFDDNGCSQYYITQSVVDKCQKITVKEPFDLEWLRHKLEDGLKQWSFANKLFRFVKTGERIVVIYATEAGIPEAYRTRQGEKGADYVVFDFDLLNKIEEVTEGNRSRPLEKEARMLFFQLLCFIVLSEVELVVVPPGKKHGHKGAEDNVLNEELFPMTIINNSWKRISVRNEGFWVDGEDGKGFYRLQACGPKWTNRELIWIKPFRKNGYIRGAAKPEQ